MLLLTRMEKPKQFAENIDQARMKAFQQKYLDKIRREYERIMVTFREESRREKERKVSESLESLGQRLAGTEDFEFGEVQRETLKLKLARYFQINETCDLNTLYDAIIETPKFINADKGSLHRLLEIHEQKTLEKIAQIRKQRAEMTGDEAYNPYEALLRTDSGKYYMARLLNMPHLEEESEYMNHCVGTSDSYVNRIKRGEIEILSLRRTPESTTSEDKSESDTPILTFEYDPKSKEILQMKKADDNYLKTDDSYFSDVIDALKKLRQTKTDAGEFRDFREISRSELENIEVADYHVLTEEGEIYFKDFDPEKNLFVLKIGKMEITASTSKEDAAKFFQIIENIEIRPQEIAYTLEEINENTKAYVGKLEPGIFNLIQKHGIEHVYTSFPEGKIQRYNIEIGGKTAEQLKQEMDAENIWRSQWADQLLDSKDFVVSKNIEKADLVRLSVKDLGFPQGATTQEIYDEAEKLGLELCPAEVGPHLRLQYSRHDWFLIAMKQIIGSDGFPSVFFLYWGGERLGLHATAAKSDEGWGPDYRFVFRLRK